MKKILIVLALVDFAFSCKSTTCDCQDSSCDGQCMEMMECGDCDGSSCGEATGGCGSAEGGCGSEEGGTCPMSGK